MIHQMILGQVIESVGAGSPPAACEVAGIVSIPEQ